VSFIFFAPASFSLLTRYFIAAMFLLLAGVRSMQNRLTGKGGMWRRSNGRLGQVDPEMEDKDRAESIQMPRCPGQTQSRPKTANQCLRMLPPIR